MLMAVLHPRPKLNLMVLAMIERKKSTRYSDNFFGGVGQNALVTYRETTESVLS
jgi:hypothetical protein